MKVTKPIPTSLGSLGDNILSLLTDDAIIAGWNNEGLPSDAMSTENATILTHSIKWPLMIDPQLQGLKWIKNKYGRRLAIIRLNQRNYMETVERCVSEGQVGLYANKITIMSTVTKIFFHIFPYWAVDFSLQVLDRC